MLKRIGHLPARSGQWRAVFSSGGFLPAAAGEDVARVLGAEPIEVFGSTETSGVAWRTPSSAGFEPLPSVEVRASAEGLLEVRSPFAGVEGWQAMGDRVAFRTDGRFDLLGRVDRVAKIEDKRVSLSEIERRLSEHPYVKDVAALALEDDARQYVGAVVELTPAGLEALAAHGKRFVSSALRSALRGRIDCRGLAARVPFPRGDARRCAGQAADRRYSPRCSAASHDDRAHRRRSARGAARGRARVLTIPADLEYFQGHFAGAPVVPGVVQVKWAIDAARRHLTAGGEFAGMEALKFQRVLVPGCVATLTLKWVAAEGKLYFSFASAEARFSSGRLLFRPVT